MCETSRFYLCLAIGVTLAACAKKEAPHPSRSRRSRSPTS